VIVSHAASELAVHAKSGAFVPTETVLPLAPLAATLSLLGVKVTPFTPFWVTVNVWPPTVIVPVLELTFPLAVNE
jgi:hypothetical protein